MPRAKVVLRLQTLWIAISGAAVGAAAVAGVIVWSPLTPKAVQTPPILDRDGTGARLERFVIRAPEDMLAVTHNGDNMLNLSPEGIATFSEASLQPGLLLAAKVRNSAGKVVGFATESETIDANSNLVIGRLRMSTDWTVVLPGRGTLFLTQIEDGGAVGGDIIPAVMLGGAWNGDVKFVSTVGPHASGRGVVVGGTGAFKGATGTFVEATTLKHMSKARGGVGVFELQVSLE